MWRQSITNITNFKKNVYGNQEANGTRTTLYMYYFYYAFILIFMVYFLPLLSLVTRHCTVTPDILKSYTPRDAT